MNYNFRIQWFMSLWSKVESKFVYKILFGVYVGVLLAAFALVMSLLLFNNIEQRLKWTLVMMGGAFAVAFLLSPVQYKINARKYRYYLEQQAINRGKSSSLLNK